MRLNPGQHVRDATLIERIGKGCHAAWICRCECGREFRKAEKHIGYARAISCGCQWRRFGTAPDGVSRTPEFANWSSMIARCHSETNGSYKNYGARGIYVCDRWIMG